MAVQTNRGGIPSILIVDDTSANLRLLTGLLEEHGFHARPVPNGPLALKAVETDPPDLILLDINMPGMSGYEVCETLKANRPTRAIPIIFISALSETLDKVKAFGLGGVDYVTKPFQFEEVLARVRTHLELRRLQAELEEHNTNLQGLVRLQVAEISNAQQATILAMSKLAESRDDDTGKHLERVQTYCRILAEDLRNHDRFADIITDTFIENIERASPLHDIGKVAIPDAILCKPGKLTPEEFEIMKTHTTHGAHTLEAVHARYPNNSFIRMGIEIARNHHERWDGKGYLGGLQGDRIPLSARVMSVADVYDALTSERCYKRAFSHEESAEILVQCKGTQFDPDIVEAFERVAQQFRDTRLELA